MPGSLTDTRGFALILGVLPAGGSPTCGQAPSRQGDELGPEAHQEQDLRTLESWGQPGQEPGGQGGQGLILSPPAALHGARAGSAPGSSLGPREQPGSCGVEVAKGSSQTALCGLCCVTFSF